MSDIGLVFSGGGGKGAYQIGVWKYLREIGLDRYVRGVSGTSVGALNAALFVGSDYDTAERMWRSISRDKILSPRKLSFLDVAKWMNRVGYRYPDGDPGRWFVRTGMDINPMMILFSMRERLSSDYMFSRDGIEKMMKECLDFAKIRRSSIPCYVTCFCLDRIRKERFCLNSFSDEDMISLLLATSAIPIVFPSEEFYGKMYCDGGVPFLGDNVPVSPIYDSEVEDIIVVHLSQKGQVDKKRFPNARILEIIPSKDLGNAVSGTLDFSQEGVIERMELGYQDAKRMRPELEALLYDSKYRISRY